MPQTLTLEDICQQHIMISGEVGDDTYQTFREQLEKAPKSGVVVIAVSTPGGDPEVARMIGQDIRLETQRRENRRLVFFGKTFVYSAGATLMAYFARHNRYLAHDTRLMIHERQHHKTLKLEGPQTSVREVVKAALSEIETSIEIQNEGFRDLIAGSQIPLAEIEVRARTNWYIDAQEALRLGLVESVL